VILAVTNAVAGSPTLERPAGPRRSGSPTTSPRLRVEDREKLPEGLAFLRRGWADAGWCGCTRGSGGAIVDAAAQCFGEADALAPCTGFQHADLAIGKPHGHELSFGIVRWSTAGHEFCYT